jgi:hypothetical protein
MTTKEGETTYSGNSDRIRLLYIAGWSRSGSTILGNLLAECNGIIHAGELSYLWERGVSKDWLCGCGEPFSRCETWQAIVARAHRGRTPPSPQRMVDLHRRFARTRNLVSVLPGLGREAPSPDLEDYLSELECLYRAVQEVTSARILIDSSKSPAYALQLSRIPSIDLAVLHLVRDPRGTAFSWMKKKYDPLQGRNMMRNGLIKNGVYWTLWNAAIEAMFQEKIPQKYLRMKYESFAENPRSTIQHTLKILGIDYPVSLFSSDSQASISVHHTVSGNPIRSQSGTIPIRKDKEWTERMSFAHVALTTSLTWPLLMRYGYPILPRSAR